VLIDKALLYDELADYRSPVTLQHRKEAGTRSFGPSAHEQRPENPPNSPGASLAARREDGDVNDATEIGAGWLKGARDTRPGEMAGREMKSEDAVDVKTS
jgi:hypothetical protein